MSVVSLVNLVKRQKPKSPIGAKYYYMYITYVDKDMEFCIALKKRDLLIVISCNTARPGLNISTQGYIILFSYTMPDARPGDWKLGMGNAKLEIGKSKLETDSPFGALALCCSGSETRDWKLETRNWKLENSGAGKSACATLAAVVGHRTAGKSACATGHHFRPAPILR